MEQDEAAVDAGSAVDAGDAVGLELKDSLKAIVIDAFAGVQAQDPERALRHLSPDVVYVSDGLLVTGKDSLMRMMTRAFAQWKAVQAEVTVKAVDVISPTVAVMTWESRASATNQDGTQMPFGGVTTAVFQNQNGRWQIVRQHQCAPMPPEGETAERVLKQY